jgi:hypothetical protein
MKQIEYFAKDRQMKFLSNSQLVNFLGTPAYKGCPARALAELNGTCETKPTVSMLVGSFVDAYFDGTLQEFKHANIDIFTVKGELKAEFKQAERIIEVATGDDVFMKYMDGEKQHVFELEMFGFDVTGKIDVLHEEAIVDLKVVKSLREKVYIKGLGHVDFIYAGNYFRQLSIYQHAEYLRTGIKKPCFIAALSKENVTDKEIIHIPQEKLDYALGRLEFELDFVHAIKQGDIAPTRCNECSFCISTKKLAQPISYYDLL